MIHIGFLGLFEQIKYLYKYLFIIMKKIPYPIRILFPFTITLASIFFGYQMDQKIGWTPNGECSDAWFVLWPIIFGLLAGCIIGTMLINSADWVKLIIFTIVFFFTMVSLFLYDNGTANYVWSFQDSLSKFGKSNIVTSRETWYPIKDWQAIDAKHYIENNIELTRNSYFFCNKLRILSISTLLFSMMLLSIIIFLSYFLVSQTKTNRQNNMNSPP